MILISCHVSFLPLFQDKIKITLKRLNYKMGETINYLIIIIADIKIISSLGFSFKENGDLAYFIPRVLIDLSLQ